MKFQFLNESYLNFEKALLTYYNGAEPAYSLTDAIAKHMDNNRVNYFVLPASKSKDNLNHTFYFKVVKGMWEFDYME